MGLRALLEKNEEASPKQALLVVFSNGLKQLLRGAFMEGGERAVLFFTRCGVGCVIVRCRVRLAQYGSQLVIDCLFC